MHWEVISIIMFCILMFCLLLALRLKRISEDKQPQPLQSQVDEKSILQLLISIESKLDQLISLQTTKINEEVE